MKKLLVSLLAAGMMFSTFACTKNSGKKPTDTDPAVTTTEKEVYVSSSVDDPDEPDGLLIANEGVSDYVIVRGANASVSEITASTELQSYLKQISNVELPIVTDDTAEAKYEIVVGKTNREEAGEFDRNELGDDGFVIKTAGKKLYLVGGEKRGTLYSVYSFLEEYLGCRYYSSTVEVVPEKTTILLDENMPEDKQIPTYMYRSEWYIDGATSQHHAKLKLNGDFNATSEEFGGYLNNVYFNHNIFNLMAPYANASGPVNYDENPDMFSEPGYSQPCFTNPKVIEVIINNARQYLNANPNQRIMSLGFMDNNKFCTCANCTAALNEEQGRLSGVYLRFVNAIAGALKEEFPNVLFSAFAYVNTTEPPKVTRAAENVIIIYCTMDACFVHPLRNDYINGCRPVETHESSVPCRHGEWLVGWGEMCDQMLVWNYATNYSNYNLYFANFDVMRDNANLFAECGAIGQFEQTCCQDSVNFVELRRYVAAKLLWNPTMSEEEYQAYINDFLQGYYGPSWEYIRQYIDATQENLSDVCLSLSTQPDFEESFFKLEKGPANAAGTYPSDLTADMIINYESTDWAPYLNWYIDYVDQEYFITGDELFGKAISEATDEVYRSRIEKAALQVEYARTFLKKLQVECGIAGYADMIQAYIDDHPTEFAGIDDPSSLKTLSARFARKQAQQAYKDFNRALRDKLVSFGVIRTREGGKDIRDENLEWGRTASYW